MQKVVGSIKFLCKLKAGRFTFETPADIRVHVEIIRAYVDNEKEVVFLLIQF